MSRCQGSGQGWRDRGGLGRGWWSLPISTAWRCYGFYEHPRKEDKALGPLEGNLRKIIYRQREIICKFICWAAWAPSGKTTKVSLLRTQDTGWPWGLLFEFILLMMPNINRSTKWTPNPLEKVSSSLSKCCCQNALISVIAIIHQ